MEQQDRLRRIRLVSERYHELQGLRGALIGSAFTLSMGLYLVATGWNDGVIHVGFAIGLALAITILGMRWLDGYYEISFGREKPGAAAQRLGTFVIPVSGLLGMILDDWLPGSSNGGIFMGLGAFWLWIALRDWPLRGYHLIGAIAGFTAAGAQLTVAARHAPDSALAAGFLVIGVAAMWTGFADHRLLTSSFAQAEHGPETLQAEQRG